VTPAELSEDLLSAYLDGELDAPTRAAVQTRLAESAPWRAVLAEVEAARDALRALPPVDLTAEQWARLFAAVAAAAVPPPSPPHAPGRVSMLRRGLHQRSVRWVGAGAAVAAAAAIVAAVVFPGQQDVTPKVATFSTQQSARASVMGDPVSMLAGVGLMHGLGR
jgi:anti-sigma factor RsiW